MYTSARQDVQFPESKITECFVSFCSIRDTEGSGSRTCSRTVTECLCCRIGLLPILYYALEAIQIRDGAQCGDS